MALIFSVYKREAAKRNYIYYILECLHYFQVRQFFDLREEIAAFGKGLEHIFQHAVVQIAAPIVQEWIPRSLLTIKTLHSRRLEHQGDRTAIDIR
jgi:hypothetical protein